jgi:hypothetical protein
LEFGGNVSYDAAVKSLWCVGFVCLLIGAVGNLARAAAPTTPAPPSTPSPAAAPGAEAAEAAEAVNDTGNEAAPAAEEAQPAEEVEAKPESPYHSIAVRNPFGLRDPPPPPPPPVDASKDAQATPSALKLTGIMMQGGSKRATFVTQEPGKAQLCSYLVGEGERDGVISNLEVQQIDMQAHTVRVVYGGKELTLDFKNNGLKAPVVAAAGPPGTAVPSRLPVPGAPMVPGSVPPQPGLGALQVPVQPGLAPQMQPLGGGVNPGGVASVAAVENPSGLQSIPMRPTRLGAGTPATVLNAYGGGQASGPAIQPVQPNVPPEQQALMMRAQEEIARRQGMLFPPSPPIPGVDFVQPQPGIGGRMRPNVQQLPPMPGAPVQ